MNLAPNFCPVSLQDAYHYALCAAGSSDSVFSCPKGGRDREHGWTRREFMTQAHAILVSLRIELAKPRTLAGAEDFAKAIRELAAANGVNAFQGRYACKACGSCEHPSEDHAYAVGAKVVS